MHGVFNGCENFDCDLSKWDVSKVITTRFMFKRCKNFTGKGLENWNVTNIKTMDFMFYDCIKFNCDLSSWNVSKVNVEDMSDMFYNCNSLINKPNWYKK